MDDHDIWRIAARLIRTFDDGAKMASAMYADKAIAHGDLQAADKWNRITAAIQALERSRPHVRNAMN